MNIYKQLNKINDTESLSEKYNVKNAKELKKLQESQIKRAKKIKLNESLSDTQEEAIDITKDYILDNYSWSDWDSNVEGSTLTFTIWFDDDWGGEDSSETIFKLDINKLVEYMNDEEDLGNYIESGKDYTNYEARGNEFYRRAEKELEKHFGCTNAYLEPSTQMGRGGTFLFADDMSFEGNFDYQTGEEYIREDNFDGFLQLCLNSFTPRTDESLKEDTHSKYSNRVEGNKRYFDTMGNKIRYCLLDVIRCKGYTALYWYIQSLNPDKFSAYAPDFTTKLGDRYQDDSVDINRADTFGKIADDLQQQFIDMVSKVDSRKHSVYEDKTPEELWNNSPVEVDGKHYAKVQNFKKKLSID